jgi:hypothetical protein
LVELENQETGAYEKSVLKSRHSRVNNIIYKLEDNIANSQYDTNTDSIVSSVRYNLGMAKYCPGEAESIGKIVCNEAKNWGAINVNIQRL